MAFRVLVRESVDDVFIRIEAISDEVEILGVARIVGEIRPFRWVRLHERGGHQGSSRVRACTVSFVFSSSSKTRLTVHDLDRFASGTLFHRVARAVCRAGCLPRKELFEAWEVARRTRRLFRGGRVVDLAAGHGMLAQIMLLLDDSSPEALIVDQTFPASSAKLHEVLLQAWPRLSGRVSFVAKALDEVIAMPNVPDQIKQVAQSEKTRGQQLRGAK